MRPTATDVTSSVVRVLGTYILQNTADLPVVWGADAC